MMGPLIVHVPAIPPQAAVSITLAAGESAQFGRGSPECPVRIALTDPAVPRVAGEVLATNSYWHLSNLSRDQSLLVENPEGAGEYVRIAPRRLSAPIPFEFSRVVIATRAGTIGFQVYAPGHTYLDSHAIDARPGTATISPFCLSEEATYFLVLVALCEPRLRDVSSVAVPTTPQIVERLRRHPKHRRISASAVGFHIDYLADAKLRVKTPRRDGRLDGKREALISVALKFGLVHERHLELLPPRRTTTARRVATP